MFVVCLGTIGEGRAGHGQQVGVGGHQRGLRRAQQAPAGTTQAAASGQLGADQSGRWGGGQRVLAFICYLRLSFTPHGFTHL